MYHLSSGEATEEGQCTVAATSRPSPACNPPETKRFVQNSERRVRAKRGEKGARERREELPLPLLDSVSPSVSLPPTFSSLPDLPSVSLPSSLSPPSLSVLLYFTRLCCRRSREREPLLSLSPWRPLRRRSLHRSREHKERRARDGEGIRPQLAPRHTTTTWEPRR